LVVEDLVLKRLQLSFIFVELLLRLQAEFPCAALFSRFRYGNAEGLASKPVHLSTFLAVGQRHICSQSLRSSVTLFLRHTFNTPISELINGRNYIVSGVDLLMHNIGEKVGRFAESKQRL
jgi:hypothetical protein